MDVVDEAPADAAGASLAEDPETRPFGGLFARRLPETPLPEGMLRPVARNQSQDAPEVEEEAPQGFFARLAQRAEEIEAARAAEAAEDTAPVEVAAAELAPETVEDVAAAAPEEAESAEPQGFFARLAQRRAEEDAAAEAGAEGTEVATLEAPETITDATPEPIALPGFGEMTPVCGMPRRSMGQQVARYPETGRARYAVYDTVPGQAEPRLMYVTGFADGCPRQIWAALAMFGSYEMHEQVRYLLPERAKPYSDTDQAYEDIKAEECGVEAREPCGNRMRAFQRDGVFLSVYERLGRGGWANMLLHDGEVLAVEGL